MANHQHFGRTLSQSVNLQTEFSAGSFTFADCKAFARATDRQSLRGDELPDERLRAQPHKVNVSAAASSRLLRGMQLVTPAAEYQLYSRPIGISDMDKVIPLGDLNYAMRGGAPGNFQSSAPALHRVVDTQEAETLWPQTRKMNVRWEGHHIDHGKDDPVHEYVREWTELDKKERGQHWNAGPNSKLPKKQDLQIAVTGCRRDIEGKWETPTVFDAEKNLARFGRLGQYARDLHNSFDVRKHRQLAGSASAPVLPLRGEDEIRQDRPPIGKPRRRRGAPPAPLPKQAPPPRGTGGHEGPEKLEGFQEFPKFADEVGSGHKVRPQESRNRALRDGGPLLNGEEHAFQRKTDVYQDFSLYTRPLDSTFLDKLLPMGVRQRAGSAGAPWDGLTQHMVRVKR